MFLSAWLFDGEVVVVYLVAALRLTYDYLVVRLFHVPCLKKLRRQFDCCVVVLVVVALKPGESAQGYN